ncbi:MAG: alpha/beta hydrolase [Pirellulales bacterium]
MLPFLCRAYDRSLVRLISPFVRPPKAGFSQPDEVPASPDDLPDVPPLRFDLVHQQDDLWKFEVESPVASHWPESQMLRGRALGPADAKSALIVLHGACDNEYTYSRWMGAEFVKQGFRVLVPAAPAHLDRAPKCFSGAPMFWSTRCTVAGMAQWLCEVRGLIGHLRAQGVQTIGLIGYSIGSLTAGLAATIWPDLDFVCLLAPVGHHLKALPVSGVARRFWPWMVNLPDDELALFDRWSALTRQPLGATPLFLMTLFDDLQPHSLQTNWWQAWSQPARHEYRHGHMSILFAKQLYPDLSAFAAKMHARSTG